MRLVIVQFREKESFLLSEKMCLERELGPDVTTVFYNAILDQNIDWPKPKELLAEADGLILGGSGEFYFDGEQPKNSRYRTTSYQLVSKLKPFFDYIFAKDFPTLGICYGHQIIAAYAGVRVWCDPEQKKTCSYPVTLTPDYRNHLLFANLPKTFKVQYGHKDSLEDLPGGARLVAEGGERCCFSVLNYKNNIFTCQFHPELQLADIKARLKELPEYLSNNDNPDNLFCDTPFASLMLKNFPAFIKHTQPKSNG